MVPPVPTPATMASSCPPVSRQISSAVVRRWIAGLAGFSNCWSMMAPGCSARIRSAASKRTAHALRGRRQLELGPQELEHLAALDRHALGHGQDQAVALGGADEGQGDAGVAGGGLDDHAVGVQPARALRRLDHGQRDAILDRRQRIEELELDQHLGQATRLGRQAVEPHQRRVADRLADRSQDAPALGRCVARRPRRHVHGPSSPALERATLSIARGASSAALRSRSRSSVGPRSRWSAARPRDRDPRCSRHPGGT